MFNRTNSTKIFAPRRQVGKENSFPISPDLASFAPLRESSFIRFRKRKFNGIFQTRLVSIQRAHDFVLVTIYG